MNLNREMCQDCWRDLKDVAAEKPTPPITAEAKGGSHERVVRDSDQRHTTMKQTPRFQKAYQACLDDAGQITRLEPLYRLCESLELETQELEATVNTLHNLCVSAEKRSRKKMEEERSAAVSNDQAQPRGN